MFVLYILLITLGFLLVPLLYSIYSNVTVANKRYTIKSRVAIACDCNGRDIERHLSKPPFNRTALCIRMDGRSSAKEARNRLVTIVVADKRTRHIKARAVSIDYIAIKSIDSKKTNLIMRLSKDVAGKMLDLFRGLIKLISVKGDSDNDNQQGR